MNPEQAAQVVKDAFRGMKFRLEHNGTYDLIIGRMTNVLVAAVDNERDGCAKVADQVHITGAEGWVSEAANVAHLIRMRDECI